MIIKVFIPGRRPKHLYLLSKLELRPAELQEREHVAEIRNRTLLRVKNEINHFENLIYTLQPHYNTVVYSKAYAVGDIARVPKK